MTSDLDATLRLLAAELRARDLGPAAEVVDAVLAVPAARREARAADLEVGLVTEAVAARALRAVCARLDISPAAVLGPGRTAPLVRARQLLVLRLRAARWSYPEVARFLRRRCHSSAHAAARRARARLEAEPTFAADLAAVLDLEAGAVIDVVRDQVEAAIGTRRGVVHRWDESWASPGVVMVSSNLDPSRPGTTPRLLRYWFDQTTWRPGRATRSPRVGEVVDVQFAPGTLTLLAVCARSGPRPGEVGACPACHHVHAGRCAVPIPSHSSGVVPALCDESIPCGCEVGPDGFRLPEEAL